MESFINKLKNMVTLDMILYGAIILCIILVVTLLLRSLRVKKVRDELEILEIKYGELKGYPLSFKLNKATALSKVNSDICERVKEYQKRFDEVQEKLKEFSVLLAEIDDFVYSKKIKKALEKIDDINRVVPEVESLVIEVSDLLDQVLEQESMQRANINTLKNTFRDDKKTIMENRGAYHQSVEYLDECVVNIENMFSIFEEWMFASEFNKASDKQQEIKEALAILQHNINVVPGYYEKACIVLPSIIDEVKLLVADNASKGVYFQHLELDHNFEVINDMITDALLKLSNCNLERVEETLDDCIVRVKNLKEQVEKEINSFEVINSKVNSLFGRIKELNVSVQSLKDVYHRIHERFGFEKLNKKIQMIDEQLDSLNELRFKLESVLTNQSVPFSTLIISYNEILEETSKLEELAKELKVKLDNATSDEERAKKQLVKLQLIVNEMRIKIAKHRLPSVDGKFEDDIRNANVYIVDIKELLNTVPLDVEKLNAKLKEGIDYIYTLYNSVNNLVGMAVMVENAIIFGNKYRSEYPEIDSELTRAELCFSNGQYTKSLKVAISAIEKLHPGAYEHLINEGMN